MKRVLGGILVLTSLFAFTSVHFVPASESFRREALSRINALRSKGCNCGNKYMPPVEPLEWNANLEISAYNHAADMYNRHYFSHYSLDGRKLRDRNILAGYVFSGYQSFRIGENIAQGQRTLREVMHDWANSPDHCKNIMDPTFKEVAVALVNGYWVQDFGVRIPFNTTNNTAYTARTTH
jgi:uncharacterized protein YkwD